MALSHWMVLFFTGTYLFDSICTVFCHSTSLRQFYPGNSVSPNSTDANQNTFLWLPNWFFLSLSPTYSKSVLLMTAILGLVVNGFLAPITEELYFRGYLLPRIAHFKRWAPVIDGVLHSHYHFWMPWQVLGLLLGLLPAAFVIWWKRNVYLGMIIHVVGNAFGSTLTLAAILLL